jgi:hypothetical protein
MNSIEQMSLTELVIAESELERKIVQLNGMQSAIKVCL